MSDLFKEIDEAVRRDKTAKFWKDNGAYFLGGAVMLVLFTGAFTAWNGWKLKQNTAQTNLLVSALSTPFPATALDLAAGSLTGGHKSVAWLHQASALITDEKPEDALAVLKKIQADGSTPALWRDLATLLAARLSFEGEATEDDAKALYASLAPLLDKNNPWQAQAHMQAAMIAAEGMNDHAAALKHLGALLQDTSLPSSLHERARALDHLYGLKAAQEKSDTKTDTTPLAESKG